MRRIEALLGHIAQREHRPFAWGRHANDCASNAIAGIIAQTGKDPLPGVTWSTARGAARVLKAHGGIEAMCDAALVRIAPAKAKRGDVAAIADPVHGMTLLLVESDHLVGPGTLGNQRVPRATAIAAWSIEHLVAG